MLHATTFTRRLPWAAVLLFGAATAVAVHAEGPEWGVSDPGAGGGALVLTDTVVLQCGAQEDLWVGIDRAPRVLREAPGESWSFEAHLRTQAGPGTHTGLIVYRDAKNWLAWGPVHGRQLHAGGVLANEGRGGLVTVPASASSLRVVRHGNRYFFSYRTETAWTLAGIYLDAQGDLGASPKVGFYAKAWGDAAPYSALFQGGLLRRAEPAELTGVRAHSASSAYPGWGPECVLDGSSDRCWCSGAGSVFPHKLDFEVPRGALVAALRIDGNVDGALRHPGIEARTVRIYSLSEDEDFAPRLVAEAELAAGGAGQEVRLSTPARADRVRIEILTNHGNAEWTELGDVRFIGWPAPAATP
ncbi:MAG: hypothetical protein HYZ53_10095 [Planctomycetes bacterium]|nr:hypothetical protein [Planctomycetota bacterium]